MDFIETEFSIKEFEMMKEVVYHATAGLGLGSWTWGENAQKIPLKTNPYLIMRDKFLSFKVDNKISAPEYVWLDFYHAFKEARYVLDETETETLTGYSWEETGKLEKKIWKVISDHHK